MRFAAVAAACSMVLAVGLPSTAFAEIESVEGDVEELVVTEMTSVVDMGSESLSIISFEEQQDVPVSRTLPVDLTGPGLFLYDPDLVATTLDCDGIVSSHLFHIDSPMDASLVGDGAATFVDPVLMVLVTEPSLAETDDLLGHPLVTYPAPGSGGRAWEGNDEIGIDGRRVTFHLGVTNNVDHVRVVTGSCEPSLDAGVPDAGDGGSTVDASRDPDGEVVGGEVDDVVSFRGAGGCACVAAPGPAVDVPWLAVGLLWMLVRARGIRRRIG